MNAISTRVAVTALAVLAAVSASAANDETTGEGQIRLKDAPGRELTVARCVSCHSVDYIQMNAVVMDRAGWERSIHKMIERFGAPISAEDARKILDYLDSNYSKAS